MSLFRDKVRKAVRPLSALVSAGPRRVRHLAVVVSQAAIHLIILTGLVVAAKRKDSTRKTIAIVLLEHFGDIVACEPITRYLRHRYPTAYIIWFTGKRYGELLEHNPHIDRVMPLCCLTEWMLLSYFRIFDLVYNLHPNARTCPVCELPLHKKTGDTSITIWNYYNYGSLADAFGKSAGLPQLKEGPRVYLSAEVEHAVDLLGLPEQFVIIHANSNESCRDWLSEKWEELVVRITRAFDIDVVEVGLTPSVSKGTPRCLDLCGKLTLLETAEVIRRARLFIGIDSGPAHFANAVGTRGVVLLGHYRDFRRYTPYTGGYGDGSNAELLYVDGAVADMPVERVFQAVAAGLA